MIMPRTYHEMEEAFWAQVRCELLDGLKQCTEEQQHRFKQMYANGHLDWSVARVIGCMSKDKIPWAIEQVCSTLAKVTS